MRSSTASVLPVAAATITWALLFPAVLAHGDDDDMSMADAMPMATNQSLPGLEELLPSYVHHPEHKGSLLMHIILMTMAWVFVLPLGKLSPKKTHQKKTKKLLRKEKKTKHRGSHR